MAIIFKWLLIPTVTCLTGGCDPCNPGGAALATAWYLCPQKRVWTKLPDMKQPRRRHALVHVGQRIYAIGGQMGDKYDFPEYKFLSLRVRVWVTRIL